MLMPYVVRKSPCRPRDICHAKREDYQNCCANLAFSALMLLVGWKGIQPVKSEWWNAGVVNLSGPRCRFAYGPADATATHYLLQSSLVLPF